MSIFNIFQRPARLVFLDDDLLFLQVLNRFLPKDWYFDLFVRTSACLDFLAVNSKDWSDDFEAQRQMIASAKTGASFVPLILQYWRNHPNRYGLVQMAVFDYNMPGQKGLDALCSLKEWGGRKILLTGEFDDKAAIDAFNRGLLDQYISKLAPDFVEGLQNKLQALYQTPLACYQALWSNSLSQKQQRLLADPKTAESLQALMTQYNWIELAVTAAPFGILGCDSEGRIGWLQLEATDELTDLIELAGEAEFCEADKAAMQRGEILLSVELRLALNDESIPKLLPACHVSDRLVAAYYDLGDAYALDRTQSYLAYCQQHPSRLIKE